MKTQFNMMVNRRIFTIAIALMASSSVLYSQTTVNASGGSQSIDNHIFDYSIGEMAVVSTVESANIIVTHGVLQPVAGIVTSLDDNPLDFGLTVYPNPASNILNLQPALSGGGILDFVLTDMHGKAVLRQTANLHHGNELQQFDVSALAAGSYVLYTTFTQQGNPHSKTFKIIKQTR